jgi:excisionase family DNA binding protein
MSRSRSRLVYTVTEAGELLGLGRSTAYELAAQGELPTVRLGRRLMVTRPALTALLGFEPPLPYELDDANRTVAQPTLRRRPQTSRSQQPGLPFTG